MRSGKCAWLICASFVVAMATLPHVERYEVVRPQRERRRLQQGQRYPDAVRYQLTMEGRTHHVHLEKNRELLGGDYTETFYSDQGERVTLAPREDHCFYHGHLDGWSDSSVSVSICSGIRGSLRLQRDLYLIEPLGDSDDGDHAIYKQEHLKASRTPASGSSNISMLLDKDRGPQHDGLFSSWSLKTKAVSTPQMFVELFVVVDNTEYQRYGAETKSRVLGAVNHVDQLYQPLNIRVVLVGLEIWTKEDLIDVDMQSETTLDHFLLWRQSDLLKRIQHDNAQFVTGRDFDGDTVGLANKFAMCTQNSGGVNQDHHANVLGLASTIAHEMGHNLGLSHDDGAGCVCPPTYSSGSCVMSDRLRTGNQAFPEFFSGCSVDQLTEFLARAQPNCLHRPASLHTVGGGPHCGNSLLEPPEECDCGSPQECENSCCDASTCRLSHGSACAHGLCCNNCQLREAGSVCREASRDCDLPEFCSGVSALCPEDSFHMDGRPCYNQGHGFCHQGRCPTHTQHCWRLFGPGSSVAAERCFDLNRRGDEGTNCGRTELGFTSCSPQNLKCGSIFCQGGGESITGRRASFSLLSIDCNIAVDDDRTRNIHMVPPGASCGPDQVCLSNRCVDVSVYGRNDDCAKKCNNHGVCNHKQVCHCDAGWAPPHCDVQYSDTHSGGLWMVCVCVSLLLLVSVVLVGLMYCRRDKRSKQQRKSQSKARLSVTLLESNPKQRLDISSPTFISSTATLEYTVKPKPGPPSKPVWLNTAAPRPPPPVPPVQPCGPKPAL